MYIYKCHIQCICYIYVYNVFYYKDKIEDKMVGWHQQLHGHEFEQAPGDGEGKGSLAYCSSWGHKESETTEQLNNKLKIPLQKPKHYF